jgi:sortase A
MRYLKNLERLLFVVGFGLLAFWAAARVDQALLSRGAIDQFEDVKQQAGNGVRSGEALLPASSPDFFLWSEQRVKHYEESLSRHLAPPLAVLRIGRIQVEAPVLEGTDEVTLNRGVGHIESTARFGENGNVGIAGHRDGFFRGLKDIKVGDRVEVERPDKIETYVVDRMEVVDPANVSVLRSNSGPALTLVTCYPFYYVGSAPQRYIVHATLAESETRKTLDAKVVP